MPKVRPSEYSFPDGCYVAEVEDEYVIDDLGNRFFNNKDKPKNLLT